MNLGDLDFSRVGFREKKVCVHRMVDCSALGTATVLPDSTGQGCAARACPYQQPQERTSKAMDHVSLLNTAVAVHTLSLSPLAGLQVQAHTRWPQKCTTLQQFGDHSSSLRTAAA